jgi:MOSC domain-containing protein YiiM
MKLHAVNRGQERLIDAKGGVTGIYKIPMDDAILITANGMEGDVVADKQHHGGVDQAIYVYGLPDYQWWEEKLSTKLAPGTFGDNLTITDLQSAEMNVGDRLVIGSVVLQATASRIPCATLARRMNDTTFVKQFIEAERPGVYCRVLQEGTVRAGDPVRWERYEGETVTILETYRDFFHPDLTEATLRRFLDAPIAVRLRAHKEQQWQDFLAQRANA